MVEKTLTDLDLGPLLDRDFFPSPLAWADQVFYFAMVDRFSDGNEHGYRDNTGSLVAGGSTPVFRPEDAGNAVVTEHAAKRWHEAGAGWCGGTLRGLASKIGYLKRLGVTVVRLNSVFKQVTFERTYDGRGIQNFLDVDPHVGTREDLRDMVRTAHDHGLYVALDIVLKHAGNVFAYAPDRYWTEDRASGRWFLDPRWDGRAYEVRGFNDRHGMPALPFGPLDVDACPEAWPDGAVWPAELQDPATFTKKGRMENPRHAPEAVEGDLGDLKNISLGGGSLSDFRPSAALRHLCRVYQFWIAYADVDGMRVDAVRHMGAAATRFFASAVYEFAQSLGKENFCLIGDVSDDGHSAATLEASGLGAALGTGEVRDALQRMVKGYGDPERYFELFRSSPFTRQEPNRWFPDKLVTLSDGDHEAYKTGPTARFCADEEGKRLALNVLALSATTLGIPCIYYGSEQRFDGHGDDVHDVRETMFGGGFGAFRSCGRHFFDEGSPVYRELATVLAIRRQNIALRRGRQYLREISGDGVNFGVPRIIDGRMRSIIAWSRVFNEQELLLAINTDIVVPVTAWITVDERLHAPGNVLICIYSTDQEQIGRQVEVEGRNGRSILLTVPQAGFVIYR